MSDLRVRPADVSDLDALVEMAQKARVEQREFRGGERFVVPETADELRTRFQSAISAMSDAPIVRHEVQQMMWVAEFADVLCGYALAQRRDDRQQRSVVTVTELFTDQDFRAVGAGESLVSAALAWAMTIDADSIDAYALPGARETKNLFERMGMTARLRTVSKELRDN